MKHVKKVPELPGLVREFGEAYAATTEKRYIPSLAAWLHRKRWTDELPELDDSSHLTENQQRGLALMHAFKQQEVGEARGQIANG